MARKKFFQTQQIAKTDVLFSDLSSVRLVLPSTPEASQASSQRLP